MKNVHVLDANIFIHGASLSLADRFSNPVTVPAVTAELESEAAGQRFDVEDVTVFEPSSAAVEQVREAAENVGEELSAADMQVLALALEKDAIIVSDDYGVQNVASVLDVRYEGFLKEEITDEIEWVYRCTGCGKTFPVAVTEGKTCSDCGNRLKRVRKTGE